jgi:putative selenate reductase
MPTQEAHMQPERGPQEREPWSARMRPVPFRQLIHRIAEEYRADGSIFGVPEHLFFHEQTGRRIALFGEECGLPLGPAAGPHTQLAQNIVAVYLAGGRYFELKTVQKLDALAIEKPCIDAPAEGYNTEWSTELSLEEALGEYVKAWVILHLLEETFRRRAPASGHPPAGRSFLFNMSVGYDLEGIRSPRMDRFIRGLIDASGLPVFRSCLDELRRMLESGEAAALPGGAPARPDHLLARISPRICRSVTLSTMHGCPPAEIEAICLHLLEEKGLVTLLKLNPTLLGYERVRETLDRLGYEAVRLAEEPFARDLQVPDALRILNGLLARSKAGGPPFGVKLTNTLPVVNTRGILPGGEMYLSGPPLLPLTIQVAARLAEAFGGELPISFCGGATAGNVERILATGIRPVTLVTDLLKPGAFTRLREAAERAEAAPGWERPTVDVAGVQRLADEALAGPPASIPGRPARRRRPAAPGRRQPPLLDCATACFKCVEVCPNRANMAVPLPAADGPADHPGLRPGRRRRQVVHLAGWCNGCGNCATFCPYPGGRPWRDKLALFPDPQELQGNPADGFLVQDGEVRLRLQGAVHRLDLAGGRLTRAGAGTETAAPADPRLEEVVRLIEALLRDYPSLFARGAEG